MPRTNKAEAPVVMESEVLTSRHAQLDDFTVVFEDNHVDADGAPVFKGLPDARCQCPHWGVVVSGELRLRYADGDDIYRAGKPGKQQPIERRRPSLSPVGMRATTCSAPCRSVLGPLFGERPINRIARSTHGLY